MMKRLLVFILVCCCGVSFAQEFLINDNNGNLLRLDMNGCVTDKLGFIGNFTDIAAHPDGHIYAINGNGELFRFKLPSTSTTKVADFVGVAYYALTATADGDIFAATEGGTLKSYNPFTDEFRNYPEMGYGAAGDLTFYLGQLYMASTDNTLVSIFPENPELNEVVIDFSTEGAEIFGIVSTLYECKIRTFAISGDSNARIFEIGWEEGTFEEYCSAALRVFGGSSEFEFKASNEVLYIDDLKRRNSSCEIADITISIAGKGIGDSIQYSLDNVNYQSADTFVGLAFGKHLIYMKDELGCEGVDSIELLPGLLNVEVDFLESARCGEENGRVVLNIESRAQSFEVIGYGLETEITDLAGGAYDLIVEDTDGCKDSVQFEIGLIPSSLINSLTVIPTSCGDDNGEVLLEIDKTDATFSLNGSQSTSGYFKSLSKGTFTISAIDEDGCRIDTSVVILDSGQCDIFIPTAFSPNEDGFNDVFTVFSDRARTIAEASVYDRWGSLIYRVLNDNPQWDGTFDGKEVDTGSYTYIIVLEGQSRKLVLSGEVTLLR